MMSADWIHTYEVEYARCNDFRKIVQFARHGNSSGYCNECPTPTGCTFEVRAQPPAQFEILKRWATLCGAPADQIGDSERALQWVWAMENARTKPDAVQLADICVNGT